MQMQTSARRPDSRDVEEVLLSGEQIADRVAELGAPLSADYADATRSWSAS